MKKGKVQTTDSKVNVLVEHEDCNSRHLSSLDFDVLCKKMSDEEIDAEFSKIELSIEEKKAILQTKSGFAISNVYSKENGISHKDLFSYKKSR